MACKLNGNMLSQEHQICDYYYQLWRCDLVSSVVVFNEIVILLEFEIAVNVIFSSAPLSHQAALEPGNTRKQLARAWLIAACSHWLNCNRLLQNVRKRWGLVPFNVRQMRPEGKGLCYHSYVTECGEWQGGARSLIGVNVWLVWSSGWVSQAMASQWESREARNRLWREAVIFIYRDGFEGILSFFSFYKPLQQSGEWRQAWGSQEIKTENNNLCTQTSGSANTGVLPRKRNPFADKSWMCWLIKQSLWSIWL